MLVLFNQWNLGRLEMIIFMKIHGIVFKVKEILCRKIQQKNWYKIQSQHWGGNRRLSMEAIAV